MNHLVRQLRSWQRREWLYSASVGAAALVLVVAVGVTLACVVDYAVDSEVDTPYWLRVLLIVVQAVAYLTAAWIVVRLVRAPSLDTLAGRAEDEHPEFDHRLVTALQLNRPGARTAGMSRLLIGTLTGEAEMLSGRHRLARLTDPNRLLYALLLLLPVAVIAALAFGFYRPQAVALLQRQLLQDVDIPRSVAVDNLTAPLHPAGDAVTVRLRVTGRVSDEAVGRLTVSTPAGAERYELRAAGPLPDGGTLFTATLPPASEPFTFTARVRDGRLRAPGGVEFAPRPVVTDIAAWVRLPEYVDPDGKRRYETITNQGEVQCHPDCGVRVQARVSKPVKEATLVLTGRWPDRRMPMTAVADGEPVFTASFDLPAGVSGYRVEVADEHGFANLVAPRRGILLLPDRPPVVTRTKEVLLPGWEPLNKETEADFDIKGMPLVVGGRVPIGYAARSDLGLSDAYLLYRVKNGTGSTREYGPWAALPLTPVEVKEPEAVGRFRPEIGVFEKYDIDRNVEFYRLPSPDPEAEPGGRSGGGRYFFETGALGRPLADGRFQPLEVGDEVELRVAVYDRRPGRRLPVTEVEQAEAPAKDRELTGRPAGYSTSQVHAVVSPTEFERWRQHHAETRDKLKRLEDAQRGVFDPKRPSDR